MAVTRTYSATVKFYVVKNGQSQLFKTVPSKYMTAKITADDMQTWTFNFSDHLSSIPSYEGYNFIKWEGIDVNGTTRTGTTLGSLTIGSTYYTASDGTSGGTAVTYNIYFNYSEEQYELYIRIWNEGGFSILASQYTAQMASFSAGTYAGSSSHYVKDAYGKNINRCLQFKATLTYSQWQNGLTASVQFYDNNLKKDTTVIKDIVPSGTQYHVNSINDLVTVSLSCSPSSVHETNKKNGINQVFYNFRFSYEHTFTIQYVYSNDTTKVYKTEPLTVTFLRYPSYPYEYSIRAPGQWNGTGVCTGFSYNSTIYDYNKTIPLNLYPGTVAKIYCQVIEKFGPYTIYLEVDGFSSHSTPFSQVSVSADASTGTTHGTGSFTGAFFQIPNVYVEAKSTSSSGTLTISKTAKGMAKNAWVSSVTASNTLGITSTATPSTSKGQSYSISLSNLINCPSGGNVYVEETYDVPYSIKAYTYGGSYTGYSDNTDTSTQLKSTMSINFSVSTYKITEKPISPYDKFLGWALKPGSTSADYTPLASYSYNTPIKFSSLSVPLTVSFSSTANDIDIILYEAWTVYSKIATSDSPFKIHLMPVDGTSFSDIIDQSSVSCQVHYQTFNGNVSNSAAATVITSSTDDYIKIEDMTSEARVIYVTFSYNFLSGLREQVKLSKCTITPTTGYSVSAVTSSTKDVSIQVTITLASDKNNVEYSIVNGAKTAKITQTVKAQFSVMIAHYYYGVDGNTSKTSDVAVQESVELGNNMAIKFKLPKAKNWGNLHSKYDTFLGWGLKGQSSVTIFSANKAETIVTYSFSYAQWLENRFGPLQFQFYEAWTICDNIGKYSFFIKLPDGLTDVSKVYPSRKVDVIFYDSKGNISLSQSSNLYSVSAEPGNAYYKLTCSGVADKTKFDTLDYIEFNCQYTESKFLQAREKKTATIGGPVGATNNTDDTISVRYPIATLRNNNITENSTNLYIQYTYYYNMVLQPKSYDGSESFKKTTNEVPFKNGRLNTNFTAPDRLSNPDVEPYRLWWFFKGWSLKPELDNVDEDKKVYVAPTYTKGANINYKINYDSNSSPALELSIYEIFKLGYGYIIYLTYYIDHDEMKLYPSNIKIPERFTAETENQDGLTSYTIQCSALRAIKRGFHFNKWEPKVGITSVSGTTCVVDLTTTEASPETTRLRIKNVEIKANWTPITWTRTMRYNKNTDKTVSNWPGGSYHDDFNSWTFNYNDIDLITGEKKETFVSLDGEKSLFFLKLKMPGIDPEYLRADDYQLSEWTEYAVADSFEGEVQPSYGPGENYDFKDKYPQGWYNSTEKSGTSRIDLYARWVEGTLAYIYNESLKKWQRGIPYVCNGGTSWSKAIIK